MAKRKLLRDGIDAESGRYIRAWAERREIVVQVYAGKSPEGEPSGDWAMPKILGTEVAVRQAIKQTIYDEG